VRAPLASPRVLVVAPLVVASVGHEMGSPDGYRVADHLIQHTRRARGAVPASFCAACAEHVVSAADAGRLGAAAVARQRFGAAVPLLRRADYRSPVCRPNAATSTRSSNGPGTATCPRAPRRRGRSGPEAKWTAPSRC